MGKRTAREARESALASGWTVEGDESPEETSPPVVPSEADAREAERESGPSELTETGPVDVPSDGPTQLSNGALVLLGVFGGLYLLYTWGWFIVAQVYSAQNALIAAGSGAVGGVLQQIVYWAATLAPALWFFSSLKLSGGGRTRRLAILLVVGAVVLVPLPMLVQGAAA
ncbi:hypothetical protein JD276_09955 [Leucobacter sp. CSA1]|uniref:DNA polymerase III subunit gamma/tau n=1 Tax=Leucobacter chromiisoli TaxID=2796471 RepID=A0A934UVM1_9MICO|nr:hypothetical protein [Leucobacter chromiisoli]MBK0419358.1 hypothetical protein [Leucobacter chromiisoli]